MRTYRLIILLLLALGPAACGHPPDGRSVQEAVDAAAAGG